MQFLTLFGINVVYRDLYTAFTILNCCDFIGLRLSRLCFHKQLDIGGNCRFCLCDVLGERKLVIGCFYKIKPSISVRHIASIFKQFKFLLFLILNHPTDCPLCDQVGICEIQNVFNVFGAALRFKGFVFSSFFSRNCGFFLKFVMSRCIHCLRCVRFMREVLLLDSWGFLGRGRHMQVGVYVHSFLKLQIIDSLIKICPVGALTSKIFVFEVRNWEISKVYFVNIYNCLVEYILVNICNSKICRVCAVSKDSIFSSEWVLDNVKNLVYNAMYQRICVPLVNISKFSSFPIFKALGWNSIYSTLCCLLSYIQKWGHLRFVSIFLNNNLDLYSFFYIKKTFLLFNIYNFNTSYFTDSTIFFKITDCQLINKSDFWLLVGLELETKFTTFGLKLKELWRKYNLLVICIGFFEVWTIPVYFLGSILSVYWGLLRGVSSLLSLMLSCNSGVILLNSFVAHMSFYYYSMYYLLDSLLFFRKKFVWGVLSVFSNFVGNCFLNFTFKNALVEKSVKNAYFFFDNSFSNIDLIRLFSPDLFSCYIGTYFNKLVCRCGVILPLFTSIEKSKIVYMNIFGKLKYASRIVKILSYAASDFFVCFMFRNIFINLFNDKHFCRWCFHYQFQLIKKEFCLIYSNLVLFLLNISIIYFNYIAGSCACGNFMITDFMNSFVLQEALHYVM